MVSGIFPRTNPTIPNSFVSQGVSTQPIQVENVTTTLTDQIGRLINIYESREARQQSYGGTSDLPKLSFTKFDGDLLKWKHFIDRFEASIDRRTNLSPVDKMNHLVGQLTGEAYKCIQNLPITNENYGTALRMLKEKFGNRTALIGALYRKLNEMQPVPMDPSKLRSFIGEVECTLQDLEGLGEVPEGENLVGILMRKLPANLVLVMALTKPVDEPWTVASLRKALKDHVSRIEQAERATVIGKGHSVEADCGGFTADSLLASDSKAQKKKGSGFQSVTAKQGHNTYGRPKPTPRQAGSSVKQQIKCVFCDGAHFHDECTVYKTADARRRQIKGRCSICFGGGHTRIDCRSTKPCFYCKRVGSHHSSLCYTKFGYQNRPKTVVAVAATSDEGSTSVETMKQSTSDQTHDVCGAAFADTPKELVVMQTALAEVWNPKLKKPVTTRLFFDAGSSRTYVNEAFAHKLKLQLREGKFIGVNRFGSDNSVKVDTKESELTIGFTDGADITVPVTVVKHITGHISRSAIDVPQIRKLSQKFPLADQIPKSTQSEQLEILIGNDYWGDIITGERQTVVEGLYLLGSRLGWILSGRVPWHQSGPSEAEVSMWCHTTGTATHTPEVMRVETSGEKVDFRQLFSLEAIGIADTTYSQEDSKVLDEFEDTIQLENGRYEVTLPWRPNAKEELQSNYWLSLGRLKNMVKKLKEQPDLMPKYAGIFEDQLKKGVIEIVDPEDDTCNDPHYMPHHAVITPQKETTKVRVVFDGSAKEKRSCASLNESLLPGPVLLESLCGILMRFRHNEVVLVSDIEKAFLQVGVQVQDRDKIRFLWLKDPTKAASQENIVVMRFARVPFGLNCSPFLLAATMIHHLKKYPLSKCAHKLLKNHYVDNCITGAESIDEAKEFYSEAKRICQECGMNLTQWITNKAEVLQVIPENDQSKKTSKVLGIKYDAKEDVIGITSPLTAKLNGCTKRELLSVLGAVYDPLGILLPALVAGKVLMQKVVLEKLKWDDKLPHKFSKDLELVQSNLAEISELKIPRFVGPLRTSEAKNTLVCFTDASEQCFAAMVYLRTVVNGNIMCNLVFAKTRLNPVKKLTIPRLELLGILVGTRILKFTKNCLEIPETECILYTDSQCALHWCQSKKKLETWVQNRIQEIRQSKGLKLRFTPTDQNPADWATRGKRPRELTGFWFNGPEWLCKSVNEWPSWDVPEFVIPIQPDALPGGEITLVVPQVRKVDVTTPYGINAEDYSSMTKLLRVTAWCTVFTEKVSGKQKSGQLTADDLQKARRLWEKSVQEQCYSHIILAVTQGRKHEMMQLGIALNEDGLLVCHGRLLKADLPIEARLPILLSRHAAFTWLAVVESHKRSGHAGAPQTLSHLRQRYWVPACRNMINKLLKTCCFCLRFHGLPYRQPLMPELPSTRVTRQSAFLNTGIDFFGPLKVTGQQKKFYVCLFTCLSVRAVHLELADGLSTEDFLHAFRRFVARRGRPSTIVSDNAPSFKLADSVLGSLWANLVTCPEVHDYCANEGIRWHYITQYAPWMGGVYERMVGLVKKPLKKVLGKSRVSVKQLRTILCEVEAIVNSRPLCYVSDEPGATILTPNHFLSLLPKNGFPDGGEDFANGASPAAEDVQQLFQKGDRLVEQFWQQWSNDYLLNLRSRTRYDHDAGRGVNILPEPGHVVVIKDPGLVRGRWRLGRIEELIQGHDGKVRSVNVRLPSGRIVARPIRLLCPVECSPDVTKKDEEIPVQDKASESSSAEEDSEGYEDISGEVADEESNEVPRPQRAAAEKARQNWKIVMEFLGS
jgi:hypothetical protein